MKCLSKMFLLMTMLAFSSGLYAAVWVPPTINAREGDAVFKAGSGGGNLGGLFNVLHVYWSHCGMFLSESTIRHNNMGDPKYNSNWLGCPSTFKGDTIKNGMPGMITETVDQAFNGSKNFAVSGGVVLKPSSANETSYRGPLQLIASYMRSWDAYYRPYAYTNFFQMNVEWLNGQYRYPRVKGYGGHCSGTIWFAQATAYNNCTDGYVSKYPNVPYHDSQTMFDAASALYSGVRSKIHTKIVDTCGGALCDGTGPATKMAWQVVNTFAFDDADRTSSRMNEINGPDGYITSCAPAPDHLLMNTYTNPKGFNIGQQTTSSSYYDQVVPVQFINGYYR